MSTIEVQHHHTPTLTTDAPPCPVWCEHAGGHSYDGFTHDRDHQITLPHGVVIELHDFIDETGRRILTGPYITLPDGVQDRQIAAADSYQLGDALIAAGRRLEQITAEEL